MEYFGYNYPFLGGQQNVLSWQSGEQIIKNDLLQLILTNPGERVMRPDWGTPLRTSVFEPITTGSLRKLRSDIVDAINRWEPRVSVDVDIRPDEDGHILYVNIFGTYTNEPAKELAINLSLPIQNNQG